MNKLKTTLEDIASTSLNVIAIAIIIGIILIAGGFVTGIAVAVFKWSYNLI